MNTLDCLKRLCQTGGPSGYEAHVAAVAAELLAPWMDEVWTDRLGNVIGVRRCGKPNAKRLLLDAHLDQIGLMVTGVEDGYLRFTSIGGVDPRMLPGREVTILTQPSQFGIISCPPTHGVSQEERGRAPALTEYYVDTGLSQEAAEEKIPVGTPMVFRECFLELEGGRICSGALDDRACFVALLRTAQLLSGQQLDVDLYIMGSTREETGGTGAKVGTCSINPDFCVAVDVTHGATPDSGKGRAYDLGGGPAVGIGPNMTRWMTQRLLTKAKEQGIAVQKEVMGGDTGTNAWEMQICNEGIATAVLSLPLRYMHTPVEVADLTDLEQTAQLLAAFIRRLGEEGDLA